MDSEDEVMQLEGLDEEDLDELMGDEEQLGDEQNTRKLFVERQNELLDSGKLKEFIKSFALPGVKADTQYKQGFFVKREKQHSKVNSSSLDQDILKKDLPEVEKLI